MSAKRAEISISKRKALIFVCFLGFVLGACIALIQTDRIPRGARGSSLATIQSSDTTEEKWLEDIHRLEKKVQELSKERDEALEKAAAQAEALEKQVSKAQSIPSAGQEKGKCIGRHTVWTPSAKRNGKDPELAAFLEKVALNNEVLVAVSNINYAQKGGMLDVWMDGVKRAKVKNAMVVALDDETKKNVEERGLPAFRMTLEIPKSQKDAGSNHAVSALKFRILKRFLDLGYSVLLSDVDVVTLKNPFDHLVRDSDVESMSDGWDAQTAYGYNDVYDDKSMGWSRYAHSMRIFVFNSGLFYIRPSAATMAMLDKLIHRVETENGWDQALFNECIFFPNSPGNQDPAVTRRVMDIHVFMNSKVLFKYLRHNPQEFRTTVPAMIHVNYHPNKFERMLAIVKHYVNGDKGALDEFPDGSE